MRQVLQTLERRNKTATKYKFQFEPKQLIVETDNKFCPEQVQIVCIHRNRRVSSKPRQLESSCTIDCRHLVVWPESLAELIEFETTLYKKDVNDVLDDKSWTIVLEGTINNKTKSGKIKSQKKTALASADLNMRSMVGLPGQLAEVQVCMRPLCDSVKYCQVDFHVIQMIATKSSGLVSTPLTSRISTPNQQSERNGQMAAITRQSSIPNALKEKTRKIEEELRQNEEEFTRVQENSPRMIPNSSMPSSSTRPKPVPPNQTEIQAMVAQMVATKSSDLTLTPLTSRISTPNQQSERNGQMAAITRQSSIPNALKEKTRKIEEELRQIDEEFVRVEEQKTLVLEKLLDSEQHSEQERELMEHKQKLVNEKEQLSRRQDYLNVQLGLEEVEFKIAHLRSLLATTNSPIEEEEMDGIGANNWQNHRRDSNAAMLELKKLMDLKELLTHQLSDMEADDEEGIERNRLVLETTRKQNFLRGSQDTFNMSKRLMNWLSGAEQRFNQ